MSGYFSQVKSSTGQVPAFGFDPRPREECEIVEVPSLLRGPNGEQATLKFAVRPGTRRLVRIVILDVDGTVLDATEPHKAATAAAYPHIPIEQSWPIFHAGFKLGNSYREHHRGSLLWPVDGPGDSRYEDPAVYHREWIADEERRVRVDTPGYPEHEAADQRLQVYGPAGGNSLYQMHCSPSGRKFLEEPPFLYDRVVHIVQRFASLGYVILFATANHPVFADAMMKYVGDFWKYGYAIAPDPWMQGGGKEVAILKLLDLLIEAGFDLPHEEDGALEMWGDSLRGDIGSAAKVRERFRWFRFCGRLVTRTREQAEDWQKMIDQERDLHPDERVLSRIVCRVPTIFVPNDDLPLYPFQDPDILAELY